MDLFQLSDSTRTGERWDKPIVLRLAPAPASALAARRAVETFVGPSGARGSPISLVTSELVTNAIVHAATRIVFTVMLDAGGRSARVEVHDEVPPGRRPLKAGHLGRATTGRGLAMVSVLATRWGVRPDAGGKTVWAEVALQTEDPGK